MKPLTFTEATKKLAKFDIKQYDIYLIDLILLCEMAWADGKIQDAERDILFNYLGHHVNSINRLAGCTVVTFDEAKQFVLRFLDQRPAPELLDTVKEVIPAVRINNREENEAERIRLDILNACLDIAASAVTKYPYGLTERFTLEEKDYYHSIEKVLIGTRTERY